MNELHAPLCLKCGYDLTGLPANGRCPECGQGYNLHSWKGVRQRATEREAMEWWLRRIRTIILAGLAVLCLLIGLAFVLLGNFKPMGLGTLFFVVLALAAGVSYVNEGPRPH